MLSCLSLMLCLFACGNKSASVADISHALLDSKAFSETENLISLDDRQLEGYFGFDATLLSDFSVMINSSEESACEYGVFKLKNTDDTNTVIDGIKRYCANSAASFAAMKNNSSANDYFLLMRLDDMVIYVMSANAATAESTLATLGAAEIN